MYILVRGPFLHFSLNTSKFYVTENKPSKTKTSLAFVFSVDISNLWKTSDKLCDLERSKEAIFKVSILSSWSYIPVLCAVQLAKLFLPSSLCWCLLTSSLLCCSCYSIKVLQALGFLFRKAFQDLCIYSNYSSWIESRQVVRSTWGQR